jgi:hypothetical protein
MNPPKQPGKTSIPRWAESHFSVGGEGIMFKFIGGVPPDVMAIEAVGKITREDYRDTPFQWPKP